MATQTVNVKYNGRTGKLNFVTEGFVGKACTEITNAVKEEIKGVIDEETPTPEAFLEPVTQEICQSQKTLA